MKAYSYVRFSRPEQLKGDSLRRQLEATRSYCKREKLELDETLTFRDLGISAFAGANFHKGQLGFFLKAIDQGKVELGSCLIVENLDRLSRALFDDAYDLFRKILKRGIDIVTLTDGKRFTKDSLNNPLDIMMALFSFHRAYDESLQKGKRVAAAWRNKRKLAAEKPMTAVCPSWLTFDKVKIRFNEISSHVEIVRRIFNLSKNGMGNGSIAKKLNQEAVTGIGRVNSWHASVVARILTNRAVLGEFQPCRYVTRAKRIPDGEPIKGYYPQIIAEELFNVVQHRQKLRRVAGSGRRGNMLHNLFSYIAKCGFCGGAMACVTKDPRYRELVCDNARRGLKCRYVSYPYAEFEASFLKFVKELDLKSVFNSPAKNKNGTADAIEQSRANIARMDRELDNLSEGIAIAKSPIPTLVVKMEGLTSRKADEEKRLRVLIAKQNQESTPVQKVQELKTLVERARDMHGPNANEIRLTLREAIRSCVEMIQVWPYEIIEPPKPGSIGWKEKRELTAAGYSLTSNVQRAERFYRIYFRNDPNERLVFSNPKSGDHSHKLVPGKKRTFKLD